MLYSEGVNLKRLSLLNAENQLPRVIMGVTVRNGGDHRDVRPGRRLNRAITHNPA